MPALLTGLRFEIDTSTLGHVNLEVVPEPSPLAMGLLAIGLTGVLRSRRLSLPVKGLETATAASAGSPFAWCPPRLLTGSQMAVIVHLTHTIKPGTEV